MTLDIMLPFWGRIDHMHHTVMSIVAQSDRRWHLVVIDDAYADDSLGEWIADLGDERIEYIRNPSNVGISANFQRSIDLATSEHMMIMGCDDVMLPGFVAWAHSMIETAPDASFYHPGSETIDADGKVTRTVTDSAKAFYRLRSSSPTVFGSEHLAANLMRGNWMNFPAIVWKTIAIKPFGFNPRYSVVQDLDLALNVIEAGGSLLLDSSLQFQYRRHSQSVSSWRATDGSRFIEEGEFFAEKAGRFATLGWSRAARAARLHFSSRLNALAQLPGALRRPDLVGARILFAHALNIR